MTSTDSPEPSPLRRLELMDFSGVDELFANFHRSATGPPGLAYGIVHHGEIIHSGGCGFTATDRTAVPGPDTVFRIASLSKSFTAAAVVILRDEGLLRLDDPVSCHIPSLVGVAGATLDSPPLTIADCLTMSAGLPSDDGWADRQESMTQAQFDDLLARGVGFVSAPGTRFEYANLGFAILGRIVSNVSGLTFPKFVATRLLTPMGLESTTFDYRDVPPGKLAMGHRETPEGWTALPFTAPGEFSAIGGILSSVRDLAIWVDGFAEAFPARDHPEGKHPLCRSSRREMQQQHRALPAEMAVGADGEPRVRSVGFPWGLSGYGYGLFIEQDLRWGEMVHHLGGYPGFGSHMRWHRETGIGVVAFGNSTYSPVVEPAAQALQLVLEKIDAPAQTLTFWPELSMARLVVERLVAGDSGAIQDRIFSPNILMDIPAAERLQALRDLREQMGELFDEQVGAVESSSPGHMIWWQRAARGRIRIEIGLTPTRPTMIQTLNISGVSDTKGVAGRVGT